MPAAPTLHCAADADGEALIDYPSGCPQTGPRQPTDAEPHLFGARVPRYVRGKRGAVVHVAPRFLFPDLAGHGIHARREPTYHVEFPARDLWTDATASRETVIVDLWESYLEAAS